MLAYERKPRLRTREEQIGGNVRKEAAQGVEVVVVVVDENNRCRIGDGWSNKLVHVFSVVRRAAAERYRDRLAGHRMSSWNIPARRHMRTRRSTIAGCRAGPVSPYSTGLLARTVQSYAWRRQPMRVESTG